jgi:hypothetical protein
MKVGDRIRVTKWAVNPGSEFNENDHHPAPIEATVQEVLDGAVTGQLAWVKFSDGGHLFVLQEDEFEVLS